MIYLKPLLIVSSIILSLWLLFDVYSDVDIAQTKNNYLMRQQIMRIVESNNIDSVEVCLFKHFKNIRQVKSDVVLSGVKTISVLFSFNVYF